MRVEGQADELREAVFPHGLVQQILQLIVDAWASFKLPPEDEDEPKITNRFVVALERERRRLGRRFRVMAHVKDLEQLNETTGKGFVEIDICVPHGFDSRCYFGIEAKKLNTTAPSGKWESRAGQYAGHEGMGCFIDGRYASHQLEGAMVGYVMDGDCASARSSISEAIDNKAEALCVPVPCPLRPARALPEHPSAFETRHVLNHGEFTMYHLLLAA